MNSAFLSSNSSVPGIRPETRTPSGSSKKLSLTIRSLAAKSAATFQRLSRFPWREMWFKAQWRTSWAITPSSWASGVFST
ncbi:hypothetical protein ES703_105547 [subsurface metagenome]